MFRKVCLHEELNENDCFFDLRKNLTRSIDRDNWDARCVSIAWDWVFSGNSSLGTARELSTSLRAHFNVSYHQRKLLGDNQAIGKLMHLTLSCACKLYEGYQSSDSDREGIDLKTIRGILPILAIAKLDLARAEKYINKQEIHDDAEEGRGDNITDRYECSACFGELWGYYVEGFLKEHEQTACSCLPCFISDNNPKNSTKYWRRTAHIKSKYIGNIYDTFDQLLKEKEGDSSWWETTICNNLKKQYYRTHFYGRKRRR